jgi:hypothetical protein
VALRIFSSTLEKYFSSFSLSQKGCPLEEILQEVERVILLIIGARNGKPDLLFLRKKILSRGIGMAL